MLDHHAGAIAYVYLCEDGTERTITYGALLARVNQLANALRADGVAAGDRVCIYMPLTIEGIVAMLACARIGAIHSVVYAGLGATALRDRIADAGAQVLIVGDVTYRKGRAIDLKRIVDDAVRRSRRRAAGRRAPPRAATPAPSDPREVNFEAYCDAQPPDCDPEIVGAEHPLFILYTSGTTGKPKGVVMTHGGYLVGAAAMLRRDDGDHAGRRVLVHQRHRLDRRPYDDGLRRAGQPLPLRAARRRAGLSGARRRLRARSSSCA